MRNISSWFILGILIVVAGCQTNFETAEPPLEIPPNPGGSPPATPQPVSPTQGETMIPPTPGTSGMEGLIEMAKKDLAQRLFVSVDEISLVEAKPVVWPNSSLGCPQPGMAYLQIPEDGALIVLQVAETLYEYHNGGNRGLFLCERNIKEPTPNPKLDIFNLTPSKSDPPPTIPDNSIPPGEDT